MKIFVNDPNEGWIVDRIRGEFLEHTSHEIVKTPQEAEIIWLIAPWTWAQIPIPILQEKFVVCTIHHIDPQKFDLKEFELRNEFVDHYFTQDVFTYNLINRASESPVLLTDYWCNKKDFFVIPEDELEELRLKHFPDFDPKEALVFGSFQRDTEGFDLKTPKLSKGPDVFVSIMKTLHEAGTKVHVLLAGWRRQYVIKNLEELGIPYSYYEKVDVEKLNILYNLLDIYLITSRHEGGPQALFEASLVNKPILSTKVGSAERTLHPYSICRNGDEMANRILMLASGSIRTMIKHNFTKAVSHDIKTFIKVYDDILDNCWKAGHED